MTNSPIKTRFRYVAINFIFFAVLYFIVSINKDIFRPIFRNRQILGIITGSFPNFIAAYIISLFPISPVLSRNLNIRRSRIIIYLVAALVFIILTIEEISPFIGASETFDLYDIIGNGMGSVCAVLTFELIFEKKINNQKDKKIT